MLENGEEFQCNLLQTVSRRFDRKGNIRIPFLPAMSVLAAKDNEMHSYLELDSRKAKKI